MKLATTAFVLLVSPLIFALPVRDGKYSSKNIEPVDKTDKSSVELVKSPIEKCLEKHPALCARADYIAARDGISDKTSWIIDSGAQGHTCNDESLMTDIHHVEAEIGGFAGGSTFASKAGTVYLTLAPIKGQKHILELHDVLLVPGDVNLISTERLAQSGISYRNDREQLFSNKPHEVIGKIDRHGHSPRLRLASDQAQVEKRGSFSNENGEEAYQTTTTDVTATQTTETQTKNGIETVFPDIFKLPSWCLHVPLTMFPPPGCLPKTTKRALALEAESAISPQPYQQWARHQYCKEHSEDSVCENQPKYGFHIRDEPELKFLAERAAYQIQALQSHDRVLKAPSHLADHAEHLEDGDTWKRAVESAHYEPDRFEKEVNTAYAACITERIQWANGKVDGDEVKDIVKQCHEEWDIIITDERSVAPSQSSAHPVHPTPTDAAISDEGENFPPGPLSTLTANETSCMNAMVWNCAKNGPEEVCPEDPMKCIHRPIIIKNKSNDGNPWGPGSDTTGAGENSYVPRPKRPDDWIPGRDGYAHGYAPDSEDTKEDRKTEAKQEEWEHKENQDKTRRDVRESDHIYHDDHFVIPYRCRDGGCDLNVTKVLPEGENDLGPDTQTSPDTEPSASHNSTLTPRSDQSWPGSWSEFVCKVQLFRNCPDDDNLDCGPLRSVCENIDAGDRRVRRAELHTDNATEDASDPHTRLYWSNFWKQAFCTGDECDAQSPAKTIVEAFKKAANEAKHDQGETKPTTNGADIILPREESETADSEFTACPIIDPLCNKKKRDVESVRADIDLNPRREDTTTNAEFTACPIWDILCNKKRDMESATQEPDVHPRTEDVATDSDIEACPIIDPLCNKRRDMDSVSHEKDVDPRGEDVTTDSDFTACPIWDIVCNKMKRDAESVMQTADVRPRENDAVSDSDFTACPIIDPLCNKKRDIGSGSSTLDSDSLPIGPMVPCIGIDCMPPSFDIPGDQSGSIIEAGHKTNIETTVGERSDDVEEEAECDDCDPCPMIDIFCNKRKRDSESETVPVDEVGEEAATATAGIPRGGPAPATTFHTLVSPTIVLDNPIAERSDETAEEAECDDCDPCPMFDILCGKKKRDSESGTGQVDEVGEEEANATTTDESAPATTLRIEVFPTVDLDKPVAERSDETAEAAECDDCDPCPMFDILCGKKKRAAEEDTLPVDKVGQESQDVVSPSTTDAPASDSGSDDFDCPFPPGHPRCDGPITYGPVKVTRDVEDDPSEPHTPNSVSSDWTEFGTGPAMAARDSEESLLYPTPTRTLDEDSDSKLRLFARDYPIDPPKDCEQSSCFSLWPHCLVTGMCHRHPTDDWDPATINAHYSDTPQRFDTPIPFPPAPHYSEQAYQKKPWFPGDPPYPDVEPRPSSEVDKRDVLYIPDLLGETSVPQPTHTDVNKNDVPIPPRLPGNRGSRSTPGFSLDPLCDCHAFPIDPSCVTKCPIHGVRSIQDDADESEPTLEGDFDKEGYAFPPSPTESNFEPDRDSDSDGVQETCGGMDCLKSRSTSDDDDKSPTADKGDDKVNDLVCLLDGSCVINPNVLEKHGASAPLHYDIKDHIIHDTRTQRRSTDIIEPRTDSDVPSSPDPQVLACLLDPEKCEIHWRMQDIYERLTASDKGHDYLHRVPLAKGVDNYLHRVPLAKGADSYLHHVPSTTETGGLLTPVTTSVSAPTPKSAIPPQELACLLEPSTCNAKSDDGRYSPEFVQDKEEPFHCSEKFTHWGCKTTESGTNCRCWPNSRIEDQIQEGELP